jgi:DNA-binding IclR family transcriptional regulator
MGAPKVLEVLQLFTAKEPRWRVERIADWIGVSQSTAYRCVRELVRAGFLEPISGGAYVLGPAFIEFDLRLRMSDPLLKAAGPRMKRLAEAAGATASVVLCRYYRDRVMFVHIECGPDAPLGSYERGQPISLFSRSPTSRAILGALSDRVLRRLYAQHGDEIADAGLGATTQQFRAAIKALRSGGWVQGRSLIVPGRIAVAAPIVAESAVLGSLVVSLPEHATVAAMTEAGERVAREAGAIGEALGHDSSEASRLLGRRAATPTRAQLPIA